MIPAVISDARQRRPRSSFGYSVAVTATAILAISGCSSDSSTSDESVTPESVCSQIEEAGIGENCVLGEARGLAVAATEVYDFDLPSVPGEGGAVMVFDDPEQYRKTVESYADAAFLAGPHRYGSDSALIFVQINEGLSSDDGQKVKDIVDSL